MLFEIRKIQSQDVKAVAKIETECFSEPWSEKAFYDELSNPQSETFVAIADGTAVGFINSRLVLDECSINNIAVTERFRGQGIGESLLRALIGEVSGKAEFITLEVRESNEKARALYSKLGFVQVGLRKNFYKLPTESAVLMTKLL